ncbi:MAG: hypothetical protein LBN22_03255 [Clostridiales Family XIII bacterium]|jgi:hypothetical protein|nr:hypothetical protein [Clostridiales Family XIII bacterium]
MKFEPDLYVMLSLITAFIYLLIIVGMLVLMHKKIALFIKAIQNRRRLSRDTHAYASYTLGEENSLLNKLRAHLGNMLFLVTHERLSITGFLAAMITIFFVIFLASVSHLEPLFSVLLATCFCTLPYLFMRMQLERIRRKASYEGENLMNVLLSNYFISGGNMPRAIEAIIASDVKIDVSRKVLRKMLLDLRTTGSPTYMRRICESIHTALGTNWSKMLAYNLWLSVSSGTDVTLALEDIMKQLREARILCEERKRLNSESVRMVMILMPLLYFGSVMIAVTHLGISLSGYIRNQFFSAEGFFMFFMSLFLYLMNIAILEVATGRKLDF